MRAPAGEDSASDLRARILAAASRLIVSGGVAALTTRAVAAAAAVQAPTLYRLFGDKRGLLDAVAEQGLAAFVARKAAGEPHPDPVRNLRQAWADYVAFGVDNPAVFAIMHEVGRVGPPSPAVAAGMDILRERVRRIAQAGRLRVPEERAVALIHATGTGVIATLLASSPELRDMSLSQLALDGILSVLVDEASSGTGAGPAIAAVTLQSRLGDIEHLSPGERLLLSELLGRIATAFPVRDDAER